MNKFTTAYRISRAPLQGATKQDSTGTLIATVEGRKDFTATFVDFTKIGKLYFIGGQQDLNETTVRVITLGVYGDPLTGGGYNYPPDTDPSIPIPIWSYYEVDLSSGTPEFTYFDAVQGHVKLAYDSEKQHTSGAFEFVAQGQGASFTVKGTFDLEGLNNAST